MTQTVSSVGENGRNPCGSMVSIMQTLTQLKANSTAEVGGVRKKETRKPDRATVGRMFPYCGYC